MTSPFRGPFGGGGGGGAGAGVSLSVYPPDSPTVGNQTNATGASGATGGSTQVTASFYVAPMNLPYNLSFNRIAVAYTNSTAAGTGSVSQGHMVGIYTMNAGTALSLVSSFINYLLVSQNSSTDQSYYFYWGTNSTSNSSSSAGNNIITNCNGWRDFVVYNAAGALPASQYWVAEGMTKRSSNANVFGVVGHGVVSELQTTQLIGFQLGGTASSPPVPFMGVVSTTTNISTTGVPMMPVSIGTAAISNANTTQWQIPYVMFRV